MAMHKTAEGGRKRRISQQNVNFPEEGALDTREIVPFDGQDCHVFKKLRPSIERSSVVDRTDKDGNVLYHVHGGQPGSRTRKQVLWHTPRFLQADPTVPVISLSRKVEPRGNPVLDEAGQPVPNPAAWYEFVRVDGGNFTIKEERNFRTPPEELEKRRREAMQAELRDQLAQSLAETGMSPKELATAIQRLAGLGQQKAQVLTRQEPAVDEPQTEYRLSEKRNGGYFDVLAPDGSKVNTKGLRQEDAEELRDRLNERSP